MRCTEFEHKTAKFILSGVCVLVCVDLCIFFEGGGVGCRDAF